MMASDSYGIVASAGTPFWQVNFVGALAGSTMSKLTGTMSGATPPGAVVRALEVSDQWKRRVKQQVFLAAPQAGDAWSKAKGSSKVFGVTYSGPPLETTRNIRGHVTLSASPFTDAAGGDFSLNNTAGAGAACRAAGFPGIFPRDTTADHPDIGAAQSQAAGEGGNGNTYSRGRIVNA